MRVFWRGPRSRQAATLEREVFNATEHVARLVALGDQFQATDTLTRRDSPLVAIHHAGKGASLVLPRVGKGQEVLILGEHDSPKFRGSLQKNFVVRTAAAVVLSGDDVDVCRSPVAR
jgi:hypothetical protein